MLPPVEWMDIEVDAVCAVSKLTFKLFFGLRVLLHTFLFLLHVVFAVSDVVVFVAGRVVVAVFGVVVQDLEVH